VNKIGEVKAKSYEQSLEQIYKEHGHVIFIWTWPVSSTRLKYIVLKTEEGHGKEVWGDA
jgi:hypothetical protein